MSVPKTTKKLAVAVYLKGNRPLKVQEIISDFQKRWPGLEISGEGQQNLIVFSINRTLFMVETRNQRIPNEVTAEALKATRHWDDAEQQLGSHTSHMTVAVVTEPSRAVERASDMTKLASTLLALSDAIGVCWFNGPVLSPEQEFVGIAQECFAARILPSMLWIAAHWEPQASLMYTTGMDQFDRPDFFLAEQTRPTNVEYLFDLVNYVLRSGKQIVDGETVYGPEGTLRVQALERSYKTGKSGLMLLPMRVN